MLNACVRGGCMEVGEERGGLFYKSLTLAGLLMVPMTVHGSQAQLDVWYLTVNSVYAV